MTGERGWDNVQDILPAIGMRVRTTSGLRHEDRVGTITEIRPPVVAVVLDYDADLDGDDPADEAVRTQHVALPRDGTMPRQLVYLDMGR